MYLNKRKLVILFNYLYCKLLNSHVHVNYEAVFTMKLWHAITNLLAVFIYIYTNDKNNNKDQQLKNAMQPSFMQNCNHFSCLN